MSLTYLGRATELDTIMRWKNKFCQGQELVYEIMTPGRMPIISLGPEIIKLTENDPYISVRCIATFLGRSKQRLSRSSKMKQSIIVFIQDGFLISQMIQYDISVSKERKSCFLRYGNSETSTQWTKTSEECPQSSCKRKQNDKLMLCVFWGVTRFHLQQWTQKGTTMNAKSLIKEVLKPLNLKMKAIIGKKRVSPYVHYDNTSVHRVSYSQDYLYSGIFTRLFHPPYPPVIASSDYYQFCRLKGLPKGIKCQTEEELKSAVSRILRGIPRVELFRAIDTWIDRLEVLIRTGGEYVL
ncbi:MAG: hypothetical protein EZS28_019821 [Streblomastix strix]|uniref:Mariner Mos1 transposase n=1 Tax=Streblomastix strix TaxID=222440 RepID=A0A5J4VQ77_9EUKA|nr:MAG: hypothetical protein EZS28_019821 [Streblomastix strix]